MPPAIPPDLVKIHQRNNRNSAANWDDFSDHRARVTALLADAAVPGGSLVILGAGNCNDVDLPALSARYGAIHLADVDAEAVNAARERHAALALTVHAPVDLSGALNKIPGFKTKPATPAQLQALPDACAAHVRAALPGPFDTVASTGILSQIMHGARLALGASPALNDLADALAAGHLRALVQLTRPGGTIVFVTDVVSSESYPLDELWGEQPPLALLAQLEQADNVFSGVAPTFVRRLLIRDPVIAPLITTPRMIEPWLWRLGTKVTLMAYALVVKRKP